MKILFASTVFPHASDPTRGTYNLALCRALAELASDDGLHEVKVVAPREWPNVLRRRGGPPLATGPIRDVAYPPFYYVPRRGRRALADWLAWSGRAAVARASRDWKPDVVLSYWAEPDGAAAIQWARQLGAQSAVIVGGSDVLLLPKRPELAGRIESVLRETDLIVTVSDQLKRAVEALCPDVERVACVRQGIDANVFFDGDRHAARAKLGLPDETTLLWVGRVDPVKNLPLLIEAFATARKVHPARLVLVGSGPDIPAVKSAVERHGLGDYVTLPGALAPSALGDWYRACDATVLSSRSEGLPNVLRESLACGRPFASVDVGGISEIGDDSCRVLCHRDDPQALAQAITAVLDPVYRQAAIDFPVRTWRDAATDIAVAFTRMLGQPCVKPVPPRAAEEAVAR